MEEEGESLVDPTPPEPTFVFYVTPSGEVHGSTLHAAHCWLRDGYFTSQMNFVVGKERTVIEGEFELRTLDNLIKQNGRSMPFLMCNDENNNDRSEVEEITLLREELADLSKRRSELLTSLQSLYDRHMSAHAKRLRLEQRIAPLLSSKTSSKKLQSIKAIPATTPVESRISLHTRVAYVDVDPFALFKSCEGAKNKLEGDIYEHFKQLWTLFSRCDQKTFQKETLDRLAVRTSLCPLCAVYIGFTFAFAMQHMCSREHVAKLQGAVCADTFNFWWNAVQRATISEKFDNKKPENDQKTTELKPPTVLPPDPTVLVPPRVSPHVDLFALFKSCEGAKNKLDGDIKEHFEQLRHLSRRCDKKRFEQLTSYLKLNAKMCRLCAVWLGPSFALLMEHMCSKKHVNRLQGVVCADTFNLWWNAVEEATKKPIPSLLELSIQKPCTIPKDELEKEQGFLEKCPQQKLENEQKTMDFEDHLNSPGLSTVTPSLGWDPLALLKSCDGARRKLEGDITEQFKQLRVRFDRCDTKQLESNVRKAGVLFNQKKMSECTLCLFYLTSAAYNVVAHICTQKHIQAMNGVVCADAFEFWWNAVEEATIPEKSAKPKDELVKKHRISEESDKKKLENDQKTTEAPTLKGLCSLKSNLMKLRNPPVTKAAIVPTPKGLCSLKSGLMKLQDPPLVTPSLGFDPFALLKPCEKPKRKLKGDLNECFLQLRTLSTKCDILKLTRQPINVSTECLLCGVLLGNSYARLLLHITSKKHISEAVKQGVVCADAFEFWWNVVKSATPVESKKVFEAVKSNHFPEPPKKFVLATMESSDEEATTPEKSAEPKDELTKENGISEECDNKKLENDQKAAIVPTLKGLCSLKMGPMKLPNPPLSKAAIVPTLKGLCSLKMGLMKLHDPPLVGPSLGFDPFALFKPCKKPKRKLEGNIEERFLQLRTLSTKCDFLKLTQQSIHLTTKCLLCGVILGESYAHLVHHIVGGRHINEVVKQGVVCADAFEFWWNVVKRATPVELIEVAKSKPIPEPHVLTTMESYDEEATISEKYVKPKDELVKEQGIFEKCDKQKLDKELKTIESKVLNPYSISESDEETEEHIKERSFGKEEKCAKPKDELVKERGISKKCDMKKLENDQKTTELKDPSKSPGLSTVTPSLGFDPLALLKSCEGARRKLKGNIVEKFMQLRSRYDRCDKKELLRNERRIFSQRIASRCVICKLHLPTGNEVIAHISSQRHVYAMKYVVCADAFDYWWKALEEAIPMKCAKSKFELAKDQGISEKYGMKKLENDQKTTAAPTLKGLFSLKSAPVTLFDPPLVSASLAFDPFALLKPCERPRRKLEGNLVERFIQLRTRLSKCDTTKLSQIRLQSKTCVLCDVMFGGSHAHLLQHIVGARHIKAVMKARGVVCADAFEFWWNAVEKATIVASKELEETAKSSCIPEPPKKPVLTAMESYDEEATISENSANSKDELVKEHEISKECDKKKLENDQKSIEVPTLKELCSMKLAPVKFLDPASPGFDPFALLKPCERPRRKLEGNIRQRFLQLRTLSTKCDILKLTQQTIYPSTKCLLCDVILGESYAHLLLHITSRKHINWAVKQGVACADAFEFWWNVVKKATPEESIDDAESNPVPEPTKKPVLAMESLVNWSGWAEEHECIWENEEMQRTARVTWIGKLKGNSNNIAALEFDNPLGLRSGMKGQLTFTVPPFEGVLVSSVFRLFPSTSALDNLWNYNTKVTFTIV